MTDPDWLSERFESQRPRLSALAYRMLGSYEDAEDAVQETWLRVGPASSTAVENLAGWLTTISARICLDKLRARRSRPEDPAGTKAPDERLQIGDAPGPEHEALMAESLGSAMLIVLDRLAPAERVAFVLHDVFAVQFDQIGEILERTPEAARQLASRTRRRVQGTTQAVDTDLVHRRKVVDAFLAAARGGDFNGLLAVLDPDVVLRPDAAAMHMGAAAEARGARAVARLLQGSAHAARRALVGGMPGLAWAPGGRISGAIAFDITAGRIVEIDFIGKGEHLDDLDVVLLDS